ncbi:MAG: DUF4446 family protein [Eubacteriales bacterium]|nr:DUF4446 family protein [Eubacteriales bacterium]
MFTTISNQTIISIACILVSFVSLAMAFIALLNYRKLYKEYDYFMRGRDAESLEDLILEEKDAIFALQSEDENNKEYMRAMNRNVRASFQKMGVVHYDAFEGMGGKMSFALALLDYTNSGFVINCMHAREGCFMYVKEIDAGTTEVPLGNEEKEALERALGYIKD